MTHWIDRPGRARLVAGLLAALLSLVQAPAANAAGTLTADRTIMYVKDASAKAKVTLTWSSGSAESVQVFVRIGDGQFTPTGLAGPSGTGAYAEIQYGKPYLFRLFSPAGQPLQSGATVIVSVKLLERAEIDPGCVIQCIQEIGIQPHGTYADVHVETRVPAGVVVQASTAPPNADGSCKSTALADTVWQPNMADEHNAQLTGLDSDTEHCLKVIAKDAKGHESVKYASFKTLRRFVTVNVTKIFILNDSDNNSEGEIDFVIGVENHWDNLAEIFDVDSGEYAHINKSYTVVNAPKQVKLTVRGRDDEFPELSYEWSWLYATLDVGGPGDAGEVFTKTFALPSVAEPGDDLWFNVQGSFAVTYAP